MPPAYEILLLNTAIPQIQAAQSGDTYVVPRDIAINATAIISANSATDALRITQTGAGNAILVEDSANPDSTPFVVTATGDVGIGTSSPSRRLDVRETENTAASSTSFWNIAYGGVVVNNLSNTANTVSGIGFYGGSAATSISGIGNILESTSLGALGFFTGGSGRSNTVPERMRLDSSGNLGLGVTPSAWNGIYKVIQTDVGSIYSSSSYNNVGVGANVFYNAANSPRYIRSDYATLYGQDDGSHVWYTSASGTAGNAISFTQAMTLDASGNLGVGTTNPQSRLDVARADSSTYDAGNMLAGGQWQRISNSDTTANNSTLLFFNPNGAWSAIAGINTGANSGTLAFGTRNSGGNLVERARITSGGYFKASDTGSYIDPATFHEFTQTANSEGLQVRATNASYSNSAFQVRASRNTTNNSYYLISCYNDGGANYRLRVADSGDVTNVNGTYGTISDAKMKTDIVDAGSQWADIKALRFRKFKMKDDPSGLVQLGVVAQEVELTSPGLVDEHADKDAEGNDLGTTTKSVKTSVLLMKAAVALQEAMARIEKLEAEVAALKGA